MGKKWSDGKSINYGRENCIVHGIHIMTTKFDKKLLVIGLVTLIAIAVAAVTPPVPQDPAYHDFADKRAMLGVANFWNTVSNVPFLLVGCIGLLALLTKQATGIVTEMRPAYLIFFVGVALVAFGSGYYHLNPNNETLVWDRLPMTISFMAFFSIIVAENVSVNWGRRMLIPLLLLGAASVFYWHFTELQGAGDLRPYALVQFLPMLLIPVLLLQYPSRFASNGWVWAVLAAYVASKITEFADVGIFEAIGFSGHAIKHLLAALGTFFFFWAVRFRRVID